MATPKPPNFWQRIQNFLTDKNRVGIRAGQPKDAAPKPAVYNPQPSRGSTPPDYPVKGTVPSGARAGQPSTAPPPQDTRSSAVFGRVGAEPGSPITPPNVSRLADTAIPAIKAAEGTETTRANASLAETGAATAGREKDLTNAITADLRQTDINTGKTLDITAAGKADVANLPAQVKADTENISNQFKATTDVDIGKIESLGREAVGMALDGKNSAAQSAVEAQQGSVRNAIAQINGDPSIPQSRKTAMIAQIQAQGSMQIAATVGANIKDFTAMQTGAMTATMNAVGSAMTSRNAVLGQLGGAEINAVASAHETAAQLSKGYDDMAATALNNQDQLQFQYNTLRENAAAMNNQTDMQLLADDHYVGGMPTDFQLTNLQLTRDMMQSDFAMQLQSRGFKTMEEAIAKGDKWAQQTALYSALAPFMKGPMAIGLSFLPMLTGGGGGQPSGGQA